jgi:acetyl esterase/lipase
MALAFLPRANSGEPVAAGQRPIRIIRDIEYRPLCPGEDPAKEKNKLDLYLPKDRTGFPVLFFVHGGAWRHGDKQFLGVYATLGMHWARNGIGVVVVNYRLSPEVKHPEHIKDVARAFAWTHDNIGRYGGLPDQIFGCGHSAGGHLVALLATDEQYLRAEKLDPTAIRGVIPISGVFRVYGFELAGPAGVGRAGRGQDGAERPRFTPFATIFGTDEKLRKEASPLDHVRPGLPPFLIFYAEYDLPQLGRMARDFASALQQAGCPAQITEVKKSNHISILVNLSRDKDPVSEAICRFIARDNHGLDRSH